MPRLKRCVVSALAIRGIFDHRPERSSLGLLTASIGITLRVWPLYHYNPLADPKLSVDYSVPNGNLVEFINGENRYADLNMIVSSDSNCLHPIIFD